MARAHEVKREKVKTMDVILVIIGILTVVFTITMTVLYWTHYAIPDTLVTCWFAAVTGECGFMGLIQTTKVRNQDRQWQIEDYERLKAEEEKRNARFDEGSVGNP